jgi:hypothetical protein
VNREMLFSESRTFVFNVVIFKWDKLKLKKSKLFYIYIVFICVKTK